LAAAAVFASTAEARDRVAAEAYAGAPFGIGRVTVQMPDEETRFSVQEKNGRALYSAVEQARLRGALRNVLGVRRARDLDVYFVFKGDQPLDLTIYTPEPQQITLPVVKSAEGRAALVAEWWKAYTRTSTAQTRSGDYPPLVQNYLTGTLARRMELAPPTERKLFSQGGDELGTTLGLLMGTESIRAAMQKKTLLGGLDRTETANLPLPKPVTPPEVPIPEPAKDVQIEPIAMHVPVECFYVRFGNFGNYMWLREFVQTWGGDTRNLLSQRGVDYGINERMQEQLSVRETALDKLLGPTSVEDVAMIGNDTFLREGASIGVLLQAKNNLGLAAGLRGQRALTLAKYKDAKEETVEIAGHKVAFLSTPDNRVRSFYAVDGDYHLVTTSRNLVRRFYEAGEGKDPLGTAKEFRYARTRMPLSRDDTVFIYLSDPFFRQFVGPHYRVEMTRRMQAAADAELVQMAQLAARAEGIEASSIGDLIKADLLPAGFGRRTDGSSPVLVDGGVQCSARGAYGSFLPAPDMEVEGVTPSEVEAYERFSEMYRNQWRRMDPAMIAIDRIQPQNGGSERIALDIYITPYAKAHYGFLAQLLGEPTRKRLKPVAGDLLSAELVFGAGDGGWFSPPGNGHHLFLGLRDFEVPLEIRDGEVRPTTSDPEVMHGYIGSWPQTGYLNFVAPDIKPDADGYGRGDSFNEEFWYRQVGKFTTLSFQQSILKDVTPTFEMVDAERPAQVRLRIGDLSQSDWSKALDAYGYMQARKASLAGAGLMDALAEQLRVPREECRQVAESLIGGKLLCSLGGDYELMEHEGGLQTWTTSALPEENRVTLNRVPPDYRLPLFGWFRGIDIELSLTDDTLAAHAEIELGRPEEEE
jgi:hypothetical protein